MKPARFQNVPIAPALVRLLRRDGSSEGGWLAWYDALANEIEQGRIKIVVQENQK